MPVRLPPVRDSLQRSVLHCLHSVPDDGGNKDLGRIPVSSSLKVNCQENQQFLRLS